MATTNSEYAWQSTVRSSSTATTAVRKALNSQALSQLNERQTGQSESEIYRLAVKRLDSVQLLDCVGRASRYATQEALVQKAFETFTHYLFQKVVKRGFYTHCRFFGGFVAKPTAESHQLMKVLHIPLRENPDSPPDQVKNLEKHCVNYAAIANRCEIPEPALVMCLIAIKKAAEDASCGPVSLNMRVGLLKFNAGKEWFENYASPIDLDKASTATTIQSVARTSQVLKSRAEVSPEFARSSPKATHPLRDLAQKDLFKTLPAKDPSVCSSQRKEMANKFLQAQNHSRAKRDEKIVGEIKEFLKETAPKRPGLLYKSQKPSYSTKVQSVSTRGSVERAAAMLTTPQNLQEHQ